MSEIVSIVYKPEHLPDKPDDHYTRVPLSTATLIQDYGIEGDRKGGHPKRQLNLMTFEILAELEGEGFDTAPGQMGEQIVIKGLNVNTLAVGDQLQLGETLIEVTDYRNGCDRFEALQHRLRTDVKGRMGIMARVVTGGKISIGDAVKVLQRV